MPDFFNRLQDRLALSKSKDRGQDRSGGSRPLGNATSAGQATGQGVQAPSTANVRSFEATLAKAGNTTNRPFSIDMTDAHSGVSTSALYGSSHQGAGYPTTGYPTAGSPPRMDRNDVDSYSTSPSRMISSLPVRETVPRETTPGSGPAPAPAPAPVQASRKPRDYQESTRTAPTLADESEPNGDEAFTSSLSPLLNPAAKPLDDMIGTLSTTSAAYGNRPSAAFAYPTGMTAMSNGLGAGQLSLPEKQPKRGSEHIPFRIIPAALLPSVTPRASKAKYSLHDFHLIRTLGTGSFGRVHLAQSSHNHRFYALKVLKKEQVVRMRQIEHTNSEREMLASVSFPFLVTLWGTFSCPRNLYLVMDFVEGGELFSLLRKSQRFPAPVAKFYAAEVALALDYLHAQNIIYRDLKPENLLLDRHGHIKITDFGFAKLVKDNTWTLCGTPEYLAPEIIQNKGYGKSADWWSWGILIYEMIAGVTPFYSEDPNPIKLYEKICGCRLRFHSHFDSPVKDLLRRCITPDLTKRLGNLKDGTKDIMDHPWFSEVNWLRLYRKDIDAPYIPPLKKEGDASAFDVYKEESCEEYGQPGDDVYGHFFPSF